MSRKKSETKEPHVVNITMSTPGNCLETRETAVAVCRYLMKPNPDDFDLKTIKSWAFNVVAYEDAP